MDTKKWLFGWLFSVVAAVGAAQSPQQKAWEILKAGTAESNVERRAKAVRVLGLVTDEAAAAELAERALADSKPEVRVAAATALGQMGSKDSIPKLRAALSDHESPVILAAANSLLLLGEPSGYEVYYAILTGERKSSAALLEEQRKMLRDPKKMAQFGFEQGIGFISFASMGFGAVKALRRDDASPIRAAAAAKLSSDPDPRSAKALTQAVSDKSWIVRSAALEAIAKRGDPGLLNDIVPAMDDENDAVRFTAAAAVVRLTSLANAE